MASVAAMIASARPLLTGLLVDKTNKVLVGKPPGIGLQPAEERYRGVKARKLAGKRKDS